ncbi:iron-siderophore ABC transporter substrate-binding protein [Roseibium sp. CAU 1637]|uniref:Iron-siderophore ABC transporter substrate-binding protein n=1 Tax=Roseibium limicola TaxID=2816037 RepID=A0A939EMP8_9HYPH|nr:iron-siderophore ABC transporter substrate-binding protein [Roseibium limicola]MBO0344687.1 iron-siderophore ABC transporter substrate-binding protein [Roseibium limicola]
MAASLPLGLWSSAGLAADRPKRIAVVDWALLETVLALGLTPLAATELRQYRRLSLGKTLPQSTVDLGLRGAPNYELLLTSNPDLILISQFYEGMRGLLEKIAPVASVTTYEPGSPALTLAKKATQSLGEILFLETEAEKLVAATDKTLQAYREQLNSLGGRPVYAINLGDSRHFRAFGSDSLIGGVVAGLGLQNAWDGQTSYSASAPVPLTALAKHPEAALVIVGPVASDIVEGIQRSRLWSALPMVRENRTVWLGAHNHFGALPTAIAIASEMAQGLKRLAHG